MMICQKSKHKIILPILTKVFSIISPIQRPVLPICPILTYLDF